MAYRNYADVIIIGAGPAGLAASYYLQQLNIDNLVVEKNKIGSSWHNMPNNWRVVSPQWTNILPGTKLLSCLPFSKPLVNQYYEYLTSYTKKHSIEVVEGVSIENIILNEVTNRFDLYSNQEKICCKVLICATGYYSNPYSPSLPKGDDKSIKAIHVSEYKSPEWVKNKFKSCKRILIVGRRVSAGQLLVDLSESGFSLSISARGPITPRDGSIKGKLKDFIYFPYEELKLKLNPKVFANSYPHMDGGKTEKLFKENKVSICSEIIGINNNKVIFKDGMSEKYDLIIYATGYKPHLGFLKRLVKFDDTNGVPLTRDMQSKDVRNLYFIGIDQIFNFRSRYIRGMRRDALVLAKQINKIL